MVKTIEKVGVIGAGLMGSSLAALFANVGMETILLDIVPPGGLSDQDKKKGLTEDSPQFRNRFAATGLGAALKAKPAAFYVPEAKELITIGNLEDDLDKLKDVDWIVEAIIEKLEIKKQLFEKLEQTVTPGTIITSNTSGLSVEDMCEGRSEGFKKHFAISHFFNPPRYMKLLEITPASNTLPEVIDTLVTVNEKKLGKGIVYAKNTPAFVANRISIFRAYNILHIAKELDMDVEVVDKLTGPIIGAAKSATFRTFDLVGLDVIVHVANNISDTCIDDERHHTFKSPEYVEKMLEGNLLGQKTKQGFYKKTKDESGKSQILSLDLSTLDYTPQNKVAIPSLAEAENAPSRAEKINILYYASDIGGEFTFRTFSDSFVYNANRLPEIADDIVNIDNGQKFGFGWKHGPFEMWDMVGVQKSVDKMKAAGYSIPTWVQEMLDSGAESFYKSEGIKHFFYDPTTKAYKEIPAKPGVVLLPSLKKENKLVAGNSGASIVDIGDGVACLEFHTKMNALGAEIISIMNSATEIVLKDFDGLVIANHGTNFSAGANLPLILFAAQEEEWDDLHYMVKSLQNALMGLKYLARPVVAAPAGLALGGGCEVCLHTDKVRFAAETYIGLVEVGVGLLPAGGGTKELLIRNTENLFPVAPGGIYQTQIDMMPFIARAFETIAMAKVATSGPEAVKMGIFRKTDTMTVNRDYLIEDAKNTVLAMNKEGYTPPRLLREIRVPGRNALSVLDIAAWTLRQGNYISDHDVKIARKIANVLCGGDVLADTKVSEQYLLDLEREAFVSLCGEPKTQQRIQHMLVKGKPLRN
jgi:3-hydroxyacyl-CoA dehydrogenase